MKKLVVFAFFGLLLSWIPESVFAHHVIKGKVVDKVNNSPLSGASVMIKDSSEGTITDEWGGFTLSTEQDEGIIIVSFLGYRTQEISFSSHSGLINVLMDTDAIDLEDVYIDGSHVTPSSIAQIDVNIRTVSSSQDVLRVVPGLFIAQHAGGGKSEQIFLRGFDADHGTDVNISVDGLPVNMVSQAHGQGYADLHWVIPELVHNVEFGKGTYYAERGDFTTAGYVEFKTLGFLDKNMIKVEAGQFNTFRTVGMFNLLNESLNEKRNSFVAMEYFTTDGPFDDPQNLNRFNFFARYNEAINQSNMLSISASLFNSSWDQSGQIPQSLVEDGSLSRWGSLDPTEGGSTSRMNLSAKLKTQFNNDGALTNQIYFTRYNFDLYSNFTFYLNDSINGDQIRQKESRNLIGYNASYKKSFLFAGENKIDTEIGAGFRLDDIDDSQLLHTKKRYEVIDTTNYGDINEQNLNLFGKITWQKNKWMVNLGLRFDAFGFSYMDKTEADKIKNSKKQAIVSPKLNVAFNATNRFQLYLKLGQGFHSNDARVVTRNDSLPTLAKAQGADFGLIWKPSPRVILNTVIWQMNLESEMVWSGDAGTWEPSGRTRREGIDFSLRWQVVDWLFFDTDINYSLGRFVDQPEGSNYIPLAPEWTSTGGFTINSIQKWSGSVRYRFMSDRPADEFNSVTALGYTVFDTMINYAYRNWTFGISAENLFNTKWNEAQFAGDYRVSQTSEPDYGLTFTPGTPFYLKGSVRFQF
ncbi:TonB-dependent receptor [Lutimonas zeaxanthinifaciens]|uniref:TonB-dependent receptor n=1 Tax=Lutimonas zeaxanthinifaciens TaxID=3060215 RepID=UPI00265D3A8B|nr:TonB-dependent receptor [Lutimonas sp. YSD2104]WKK66247.1 TonB-dependent receptor [Lutimonas sp. YSD2104]